LKGIHFAPYSVIFPLHNLTCRSSDADKLHLVQSGIAVHLTELIAQWKSAVHQSDKTMLNKTMLLAIHMSRSLCVSAEAMRTMRDKGILQALHGVTQGRRGESTSMRRAAAGLIDQLLEVLDRERGGARARERDERERARERARERDRACAALLQALSTSCWRYWIEREGGREREHAPRCCRRYRPAVGGIGYIYILYIIYLLYII
jgi:hypothetical protein